MLHLAGYGITSFLEHKIELHKKVCDQLGSDAGFLFLNGDRPLKETVRGLAKQTIESYAWRNMDVSEVFPETKTNSEHRRAFKLFDNAVYAILKEGREPLRCPHCHRQLKPSINEVWLD